MDGGDSGREGGINRVRLAIDDPTSIATAAVFGIPRQLHASACFTAALILILSAPLPGSARVERRNGQCFERLITSARIGRRLGRCVVYYGVLGVRRALWGFEFPGRIQINAYKDSDSAVVMVNGKPGYL